MTSANLSLGEKIRNKRTFINRTLWTGYVALPFMAAYYILGVIMLVSRSINYAYVYHQSAEQLKLEKLRAVANIMGLEGAGWFFIMGIAVMFALQGFSYVFNQSQLDFYLSQPTTRTQRIRRTYGNAFVTFLAIYISCQLIALLAAALMGAVNQYLLLEVLMETTRGIIIFFTTYNVTVLAVVLSGSLPIAILLTAGFSFISLVVAGEVVLYKSVFFATYTGTEPFKVYLSPIYDVFATMARLGGNLQGTRALLSMDYIRTGFNTVLPFVLDTLIVGVIALVFVIIFARIRQTEWAGKGIPMRPFRWVVKITACVIVGLGSGYFAYLIYESVWNDKLYLMMLAVMVLATVVTGCVVEVILESNIKRVFKGMAQTIMALAIVVLVFVIYRGDLLGYDSYVPAADKVESGAIINDYMTFNTFGPLYNSREFSSKDYMFITDTEDLVKIAAEGMANRRQYVKLSREGKYENLGYETAILYRLKNGRKVYREILIPYDIVDTELDRIVSSEEYKTGHFDVFHDEEIRRLDEFAEDHTLRFQVDSSDESLDTRNFSYAELSDAYRKDLLENYTFAYAKEHMPVGSVEYDSNDSNYVYGSLDIYENFENTIALLKKYGIFTEYELTVGSVKFIRVVNFYPGYDLEQIDSSEIDGEVGNVTREYSDAESIQAILDAGIATTYYNPWYNYNNVNNQYSVEIIRENDSMNYGGAYYSFLKGKVPDFVKADTDN